MYTLEVHRSTGLLVAVVSGGIHVDKFWMEAAAVPRMLLSSSRPPLQIATISQQDEIWQSCSSRRDMASARDSSTGTLHLH